MENLGKQRLLIVGQRAMPPAFRIKFELERANPPHQARLVEALHRVVRGPRCSAGSSRTPSSSPSLGATSRLRSERVGRLAVERVGARVPAYHLKTQAPKPCSSSRVTCLSDSAVTF